MDKVAQMYFSCKEIQKMLSCSRTQAYSIAHELAENGDTVRCGRMLRVRATAFYGWLDKHST